MLHNGDIVPYCEFHCERYKYEFSQVAFEKKFHRSFGIFQITFSTSTGEYWHMN